MGELAARVRAIMADGVAAGRMPGGVALVWHDGAETLHEAYGNAVLWRDGEHQLAEPVPATTDTIYDCASVSKLVTATCVMRLVERGAVGLDQPVARFVPEFAANAKEAVTVRQLLAHVGGLRWGMSLWLVAATPAERLRCALAQPLDHPPSTVFRYNSAGLAGRSTSRPTWASSARRPPSATPASPAPRS